MNVNGSSSQDKDEDSCNDMQSGQGNRHNGNRQQLSY